MTDADPARATVDRTPRDGAGRRGAAGDGQPGETFALFADCLLVGCFVAVAALGVVTGYVALVAGCALLRERAAGTAGVGPRTYWHRLRAVARSGVAGFAVPPALAVLLAVDALAIGAGVPGAKVITVLVLVAAAAAVVLGLRAAGAWRDGQRWPAVFGTAVERARLDPGGDALLLLVAVSGVVISWVVPLIVPLIPGPVALAVAAVDARPGRQD